MEREAEEIDTVLGLLGTVANELLRSSEPCPALTCLALEGRILLMSQALGLRLPARSRKQDDITS